MTHDEFYIGLWLLAGFAFGVTLSLLNLFFN